MIPVGALPLRDEWASYPISSQGYAAMAGAHYTAKQVTAAGPVRYCRTDWVDRNLEALSQGGPCVLVTGYSDAAATDELAAKLPANVKRWFSNNVMTDNPHVVPTPIGFRASLEILTAILRQAQAGRSERRNLLYVNFTTAHRAYKGSRAALYPAFSGKDWVTLGETLPEPEFYAALAAHDFVLSPPGAGPDCHRHWESMALGSVPVVLRSRATALLDDLPALQVDSWEEVTRERLEAELPKLLPRFQTAAMRKLSLLYWRERVEACA